MTFISHSLFAADADWAVYASGFCTELQQLLCGITDLRMKFAGSSVHVLKKNKEKTSYNIKCSICLDSDVVMFEV